MSKKFNWLDRLPGEEVCDYDKRINELAAFHAGYAFFTWQNYSVEFSAFSVYCVWDGECNEKLSPPLPSGGFMMHCDPKRAEELILLGHGVPVFLKLYAKQGCLHAERMAVADRESVYDLYFNGCGCIPPEDLCFRARRKEEEGSVGCSYRSGSYRSGSYAAGRGIHGSFRGVSLSGGSFSAGSFSGAALSGSSFSRGSFVGGFSGGSYSGGSYGGAGFGTAGSYRSFSGLNGSYLSWFFGGSSYRHFLSSALSFSGSGFSYGFGSFRFGSFSYGSFLRGSYAGGSYVYGFIPAGSRAYLLNGSFYGGSYHRGSFIRGGFAEPGSVVRISGSATADHGKDEGRPRRIIEELGYGLDLI